MENDEILKLLESNREKGFSALYNKYREIVMYTIFNIVKNREVAEDLSSEVFIKIHQKIETFKENISLEMWIKTIAINTSIDFIRRTRKEMRDIYIDDNEIKLDLNEPDGKTPESILINKEHKDLLYDAIDSLGERTKEILLLRLIENKSYIEIANEMNISVGTVKHSLHKYKNKIKQSINQQKQKKDENKKSILFDGNKILS